MPLRLFPFIIFVEWKCYIMVYSCPSFLVGGSPRPPLGLMTLRRSRKTHRTQHRVLLMAMTYYSRRVESKISEGERCMGQRKPDTSFQGLLPGESHRTYSISPVIS